MLELKNVSKTYRGIPAVWDVSFALKEGEVLGYLGPNGSGKSTTVKMVIGMIQPTKGKIFFDGRNIHDDLATTVADGLGIALPNPAVAARPTLQNLPPSDALSILKRPPQTLAGPPSHRRCRSLSGTHAPA